MIITKLTLPITNTVAIQSPQVGEPFRFRCHPQANPVKVAPPTGLAVLQEYGVLVGTLVS